MKRSPNAVHISVDSEYCNVIMMVFATASLLEPSHIRSYQSGLQLLVRAEMFAVHAGARQEGRVANRVRLSCYEWGTSSVAPSAP